MKISVKKSFPTIHLTPAKWLACWRKEILTVSLDIRNEEIIKHAKILYCLNDFFLSAFTIYSQA
ncbi:hypothetical protein C6H66_00085 [Photorhabdus hindustanensis]|uniref:Uncharacterized protein n=1 Tax=Photorhabdus hindustanensis TaxID=2918802 RepID=A0A2S8Q9T4_9GAMM|nr:hypothetical protein C6H66_00085 [Photorhabdus hindustanensis]